MGLDHDCQPAPEEVSHGLGRRGRQGAVPMSLGRLQVACAAMEIAQDGVPQVRSGEPRWGHKGFEDGEAGLGPLRLGDRHGAVHRKERRWGSSIA